MTTTMPIPVTPELHQALGRAAEEQGTTPETVAFETLQERFVSEEQAGSGSRTLADRLARYIGVLDSGEMTPGGARMSERTGSEYGKLLLKRHREGYPLS
jgi:hypothetical protein